MEKEGGDIDGFENDKKEIFGPEGEETGVLITSERKEGIVKSSSYTDKNKNTELILTKTESAKHLQEPLNLQFKDDISDTSDFSQLQNNKENVF